MQIDSDLVKQQSQAIIDSLIAEKKLLISQNVLLRVEIFEKQQLLQQNEEKIMSLESTTIGMQTLHDTLCTALGV